MRVFCSYRSVDRAAVEPFARRLREEAGIDAWLDVWEVAAGDDIVVRMDAAIGASDAGLVFLSRAWADGRWAQDEATSLRFRQVVDGIRVIPVVVDALPEGLPIGLRKLARRSIEDFDAIVDALRGVDRRPGLGTAPRAAARRATIRLAKGAASLAIDGEERARVEGVRLPAGVALTSEMSPRLAAELGERVGNVVFADAVGEELARLLGGLGAAEVLDLCVELDGEAALPLELASLRGGVVPALRPGVRLWRRVAGAAPAPSAAAPGPLKILVAVGAPDEDQTAAAPLNIEREMGSILAAVEPAIRDDRAQVRVLEVANADTIREALLEDDYHVIHLSGHGSRTSIELEDEDGGAVPTSAAALVDAFRASGKVVPLVFLSACHGAGESTALGVELHRLGVPRVLAMQAAVTDSYATELAAEFYSVLARAPSPRAGVALATARQRVEARSDADAAEWPTATLLCIEDAPLLDSDLDLVPLRRAAAPAPTGPVPLLGWSDLVGRRKEVRTALRALRRDKAFTREHGEVGAVMLTGTGGVGKSTIAGRVITRLGEQGWVCSVASGTWSAGEVTRRLRIDLAGASAPWAGALLAQLEAVGDNEQAQLEVLAKALQQEPVLLVWDNFEDNLARDGSAFRDEAMPVAIQELVDAAAAGKVLITCRHPLPGIDGAYDLAVGPLSMAEAHRLRLRLPGLAHLEPDDRRLVTTLIGGHPRMLELLDALLRRGTSVARVRKKLRDLAAQEHVDTRRQRDLTEAITDAVALGARDIVLDELLAALDDDEREVLLQVAVSNLPVEPADLAETLARDVEDACARLRALSLLVDRPGGVWVHRWTAEALRTRQPEDDYRARCLQAGDSRLRRMASASRSIAEGIEATENFLSADAFDRAAAVGLDVVRFLMRNSALQTLAYSASVLRALPSGHEAYTLFADHEARALLALGFTAAAVARYTELLDELRRRAAREPGRAPLQHNVAVICERLGDLRRSLGDSDQARQLYTQCLEISKQLAAQKPDDAMHQRELAVAYERLGGIYRNAGDRDHARRLYAQSLQIRERLAAHEPDRAQYQRELSVVYTMLGDLHRELGDTERALQLYAKDLEIAERLAAREPDRADYQRDVSISYSNLGDLFRDLGDTERARQLYAKDLQIAERLAAREPDRTDYRRDLAVSYNTLGELHRALGDLDQAHQLFSHSLQIIERLAAQDPERADYQRDLSIAYTKLGEIHQSLGDTDRARQFHTQSLQIITRLVTQEPDRADYQRHLAIARQRLRDL